MSHPGKVKINNFRKLDDSCPDTLDPNETLQQLFSQVSTWAYLWFDQCQSNIPPCDLDSAKEVTFEYNVCWLMKKDTISNRMWYLPCTDEVCTVTYKICMNPDMSLNTTITNMIPPSIPFGCTLEGYQVVEPIYHNQETEKFAFEYSLKNVETSFINPFSMSTLDMTQKSSSGYPFGGDSYSATLSSIFGDQLNWKNLIPSIFR